MKIVALAGGTGAAKFLRGLCRITDPAAVTVIGNTGDDLEMWGLSVSPDLDTVMYTLAGVVDETKGWGLSGDTFQCRDAMGRLGSATFFGLGDRDLATHLVRTEQRGAGLSLAEATEVLCRRFRVKSRLLPMSNDRVRTYVETPGGRLAFQEFFVRERCGPAIVDIVYEGADRARPAPGVLEAIGEARMIVICPSNPISSIGPILAVPGIRQALSATAARVVAVSPIVGQAPVSGPAGKMMAAKGFEVSALGVAAVYAEFLEQLVVDHRDANLAAALQARGVEVLVTDSIMDGADREKALARAVLEGFA
ncbi:MAG TPA: 2-phospho-L-lactate transferase [Polyangiaceae bacterium]|jgi:LPPG:FO 2-phospho-L-lactate transferase|nr:2-phospho-L-lactate transferase [Polyangiaceae bacterium]